MMLKLISTLVIALATLVALSVFRPAAAESIGGNPILVQDDFGGGAEFEGLPEGTKEGLAVVIADMLVVFLIVGVISLAIAILVLYLFFSAAASIPQEHQQVSPGLVWTLLIPLVNIVMLFMVLPKIAAGFQAYFNAQGRTDVGDCGAQLAMYYCIGVVANIVLSFIPFLNLLTPLLGIALLVILIMLLVKFLGYKKEIQLGTAGAAAA